MINRQLLEPRSIVIAGGSNDIQKPGGKILKNIIDGGYTGTLYVLNPKETMVQGIKSYSSAGELPEAELAVIAVAARLVPDLAQQLIQRCNTRAFIVISAGFSEEGEEGRILERRLADQVDAVDGTLIGPNCTGVLTPAYHGVFTLPIPTLTLKGCDFISGSGATACFIMENGIPKGLSFARVFSVGNSAQTGVEDILQYMDETFDPAISPRVKLLYLESVNDPIRLLKHSISLIRKGCRIAAIKAGTSEAGSRAASSHTGALASSDMAVDALFRKAGIIRCHGREELIDVASVLMHPPLPGRRIGIITHAGGPAVMLTDALSKEGFEIPRITSPLAEELESRLFPGSSVANPIDFLATGTAEQLGTIIGYADDHFDEIDAMAVIFGTPGLINISGVYEVLDQKMKTARKPIFPILPSILTAKEEVEQFLKKGHINFPDEVLFARALGLVRKTPCPEPADEPLLEIDRSTVRSIIDKSLNGYLAPEAMQALLDAAGIKRVPEAVARSSQEAVLLAEKLGLPVAMKVIGPVHKSDLDGVRLNIETDREVEENYNSIMQIPGAEGVLLQPMLTGMELFAGAKHEEKFGHLVLCGLGGIFIESLKDFSHGLAPISHIQAINMITSLRSLPVIRGSRGRQGVDLEAFAEILMRISALLDAAPEIREMDINPMMASGKHIVAVDVRINISK